jgi:chlorobactene glucosyltransferase
MSMLFLTWLLPDLVAILLLLLATKMWSRVFSEAAAGLLIAVFPFTFITPFMLSTKILLGVVQLCLLLLPARMLFGRLDKAFVNPSTRLNALVLLGAVLFVAGGWLLGNQFGLLGGYEWRGLVLILLAFFMQAIFLAQILWTFRHYKLKLAEEKRSLKDLPTVSVCIPARNETHALEDCLTSVLASSYQKLEVLVLDDCSQDKTSEIIRSFAHDGVRFIQGELPADGWLGKNQAMQTLAEQATGDYILFMDVDTRLNVSSIAQVVDYTLANKLEMVAVLPQNRLGLQPGSLLSTLRYFWQMVLPITRRHAPVAGQAWLINADTLKELGGFKSVAHKIVPEGSFARRLFTKDTYRFIAGTPLLGITTAKRWPSQLESSVRILYPTYKRQPVLALAAVAYLLCVFVAPIVLSVWLAIDGSHKGLLALAITATILELLNYALVLRRTHPRVWLLAVLFLPIVAVQEIILILVSMIMYEFGDVNWKGRNVCYPVILSGQNRQAFPLGQKQARQ